MLAPGDRAHAVRAQSIRRGMFIDDGLWADLLKLAMLAIHRRLRADRHKARMLLTVHDELVFEVPPEEFDDVAALVREEMTTPLEKRLKLEVPLKVDMAAGPNWLDVEEVRTAECGAR